MMEGFSCLRARFSTAGDSSTVHTIYCRPHHVRQNSAVTPNGRTLFTLGWPPYASADDVREMFATVGHVSHVYLQCQPGPVEKEEAKDVKGFQTGYVVFAGEEGVTAALDLCSVEEPVTCAVENVSLRKWAREYVSSRPLLTVMEERVKEEVGEYDRRREEEKQMKKRLTEPDEEGWITVVRKRPLRPHTLPQRKRKKKELLNFYRFQQRETQRQQIAQLRKQFEEDKQRVAEMKTHRKFKPF